MRFVEFAPPSNQEGTLLTLLQYLLAKTKKPEEESSTVKLPTDAILKMMNNTGAAFSFEDLEALANSSDKIKNIIKGPINRKSIEIGKSSSASEPDDEPGSDQDLRYDDPMQNPTGAPPPMPNPGEDAVANMASRAAKRTS